MFSEQELQRMRWLNPEYYLPELASDLAMKYKEYLESEDDSLGIYEDLRYVQSFAHSMVRYADSPEDSDASVMGGRLQEIQLINPKTSQPYTIEDLGIDRNACLGPTSGVTGRERMVAEVTVRLYRAIYE